VGRLAGGVAHAQGSSGGSPCQSWGQCPARGERAGCGARGGGWRSWPSRATAARPARATRPLPAGAWAAGTWPAPWAG
jgi:hypothetical protein